MFRKLTEEDRAEIARQIELEHYHKSQGFVPDQFYEPDTQGIVLYHEKGPLAYAVVKKVAHVHLQFVREEGEDVEERKERLRKGIQSELPWLFKFFQDKGYKGVIGDTKNPALLWFLRKFGFRSLKDTFIRTLYREQGT